MLLFPQLTGAIDKAGLGLAQQLQSYSCWTDDGHWEHA